MRETGEGSRAWDAEELALLVDGKRVPGYDGHHINSVKDHQGWAGNPDNVQFFTRKDHLAQHSGNWRNGTVGELVDRSAAYGITAIFSVLNTMAVFDPSTIPLNNYEGSSFMGGGSCADDPLCN